MVATASRREGALGRAGAASVPFCGKRGARERADDFFFFAAGKKETGAKRTLLRRGGERGIPTLERVLAVTRFPIVRLRPAQPSLHSAGQR